MFQALSTVSCGSIFSKDLPSLYVDGVGVDDYSLTNSHVLCFPSDTMKPHFPSKGASFMTLLPNFDFCLLSFLNNI